MSRSSSLVSSNLDNQLIVVGGQKYKLLEKIGTGSFGDIYLGIRISNIKPGEIHEVAIKIESLDASHQILQLENQVYRALQAFRAGIPQFMGFKRDEELGYNVLVMELMGPSLDQLFDVCGRKFSEKTVLMLADQILERVAFLHSMSFIHRDIKPDNFLMGVGSKRQKVFMIDFGLAKQYRNPRTYKHISFHQSNRALTGTARYASINVHQGIQHSRRDDMESLGYMLIYFLRGSLPWMGITGSTKKQKCDKIKEVKLSTSLQKLCRGIPRGFAHFIVYCRGLKFDELPDYVEWRQKFQKMLRRMGYRNNDDMYDWTMLQPGEEGVAEFMT
ncbi:unnamed protein product [Orchesella dallaii]|uniref:non-specific serine/threonine protein kinase n=1 Tax=Orchesella dallaii TaxID=48710 RepID=A0ABP1Q4Q7_9HEXA